MKAEGWYIDPFGGHEARWFSDGVPTGLVRDGEDESTEAPPEGPYEGTPEPIPESDSGNADLMHSGEAEYLAERPPIQPFGLSGGAIQ
jgi:hypothetical protein